jgi:glycosyltransferase involved in cell wall biosynthesis
MKRPRIAIDAVELQGKPTGVGRYLHNLLTSWSHMEAEVDWLLYHTDELTWPLPDDSRFSYEFVPAGFLKAGWYQQQRMLARLLNRDKPDLFFAPAYTLPLGWRGNSVLAVHDLSYEAHPEWYGRLHGLRMRSLSRRSCRKAARIITGTEFSRDELMRHYQIAAGKIAVIHHSVSSEHLTETLPTPPEPDQRYVLMLGTIFERRFPMQVLDAFQLLKDEGVKLVVVGDDRRSGGADFRSEIESRQLGDYVSWRRYVDDVELPRLISNAAAMLYLSAYEGFGLPPLEAMARGVPAVVSDRGALREIYGDTAALVEKEEPEIIAAVIRRLINHPEEWLERSRKGFELAQRLNAESMAEKTLEELLHHV